MNAHDLQFGIEIETIAPDTAVRNDGLRIGPYHHGIAGAVPADRLDSRERRLHQQRPRWAQVRDRQSDPQGAGGAGPGRRGRPDSGEQGHIGQRSCGVHVHVGWQPTFSIQALARLIIITAYLEKGLYAITGTKNREQSIYCGGVKKYGNDKAAKVHLDRERYHILNLTNLATGRKQTVEFRCFSGSTSAIKLVGWIQVCLGLVEKAVTAKRSPVWNPKPPTGGLKKPAKASPKPSG